MMQGTPAARRQVLGSLTLDIGPVGGRKRIVLKGEVGETVSVGFRSKYGDPEIALGTFETIITSVAIALGAPDKFVPEFRDQLTELGKIDGAFKTIVHQLQNAQLYITDMQLTAKKDSEDQYKFESGAFGFRVEFSELKLGPVLIVGFGILFEFTAGDNGTEGKGRLTTRPG